MSGSTPKILVILLALGTYGSLSVLILRFALRELLGLSDASVETRLPAIPIPVVEPVPSAPGGGREDGPDPRLASGAAPRSGAALPQSGLRAR